MEHNHNDMSVQVEAPACKLHMLWNWQAVDTCIVFRSWHAHTVPQFIASCLGIVLIGVAFELLRKVQRYYDVRLAKGAAPGAAIRSRPSSRASSPAPTVSPPSTLGTTPRLIRAVLYSLQVFISFFIMLVFMTYNGYLVFSVVLGAFIGHVLFNGELVANELGGGAIGSNGMACH